MPQVVLPALFTTGAAVGASYIAGTAITTAFVAKTFALNLALTAAAQQLQPKIDTPSFGLSGQKNTITARVPNSTRKLVYGRTRVGGTIVFL